MNDLTSDLSDFGYRELETAKNLLDAMVNQGLPKEFYDEGTEIKFNTRSGYVFLTNYDYQVAMLNGDNLEMWYICPHCGNEGFKEDIGFNPKEGNCQDCRED